MKKNILFILAAILLVALVVIAFCINSSKGTRYLFKSHVMHAQALRTMGHAMYSGAAPGEVLATIGSIKDGDEESWFRAWNEMAKQCEKMAVTAGDDLSRGNALLRASNYYRAAEFFINPTETQRRLDLYRESVNLFEKALIDLKIKYVRYNIPYEDARMNAYFFPGNQKLPLVLINGGYDSTIQETFFFAGSALISRGYPVLIFEGPGQSNLIREYKKKFTPDWQKPVSVAIDYVLENNLSLKSNKIILLGSSLGGLLATRAAATEKRLSGLVVFGAPFDFQETALQSMPGFARWAFLSGNKNLFNFLVWAKSRFDITVRWGIRNGMWTVGGESPYDFAQNIKAFSMKDVAPKISGDVLLLYGELDSYIPDIKVRLKDYEKAFSSAHSVTSKLFTEADGAAEHCQLGSMEQAVAVFVQWLKAKNLEKQ